MAQHANNSGPHDHERDVTSPDPSGGSIPEIELEVARTREEFAATLDAIEDKVNPRVQLRRLRDSVKRRFDDDPTPVVASAAAGAAGLVAIVAGIARLAARRN